MWLLLPLVFLGFYLIMVARQTPLQQAVSQPQFWLPIGAMAVMLGVQYLFGALGLLLSLLILAALIRYQRR